MSKNFTCNNGGFQITFENGLTASVQWRSGNYCDNYSSPFTNAFQESNTAEVAVFDTAGEFVNMDYFYNGNNDGEVAGFLSPEDVAEFLYKVSSFDTAKNEEYRNSFDNLFEDVREWFEIL